MGSAGNRRHSLCGCNSFSKGRYLEDYEPLEEFRPGHSIDEIETSKELYRLVTMVLASGPIAERALHYAVHTSTDRPSYSMSYLQRLPERYFADELSRILIYTAIQGRLYSSMKYPSSFPIWEEVCGELEQGLISGVPLGEGPLGGKIVPLTLGEAFNKIIHATIINTDSEAMTARQGESAACTNRINPVLYLYGTHMNDKPWRATLKLLEFVQLIDLALPRT
jgi:hypothetical protein